MILSQDSCRLNIYDDNNSYPHHNPRQPPKYLRNNLLQKKCEMIDTSKVIYSINIEDVQDVAEEELGRRASKKELKIIEDKVGDYIDWHEAISLSLNDAVSSQKSKSESEGF